MNAIYTGDHEKVPIVPMLKYGYYVYAHQDILYKNFEPYLFYFDVSDHSFYVAINSIMGIETLGLIRNFGFFKLPYSKKNG